ncbi:MAG: sortase [Lachnospiraceae bacterium]|nr:sortase [Lachnospiraceae bacterium]
MSDNNINRTNGVSEEDFYADIAGLAKNENLNSEEFLKSFSDLMESDKYSDLTADIVRDEMPENQSEEEVIPEESKDVSMDEPEKDVQMVKGNDFEEPESVVEKEEFSENLESAAETTNETITDSGEDSGINEEPDSEDKNPKKKKNMMYNILMVASILVFCYCIYEIGSYVYGNIMYKKQMNELQGLVNIETKVPEITPQVVVDIDFPDEVIYASNATNFKDEVSDEWADSYANLVELNPDCVGWIKIPNTRIDYPVMYTPDDYDKYLYLDFEGNYRYRGLPFMAEGTLLNVSQNYIMYGHHMEDGTAFRDLVNYLNWNFATDPANQYAYFNTAYGEGIYQLMSVVITKVYNVDDECFKYYKYSGDLTEEEFNTYVYYMNKMSSINTGVTAVYGDQLISLSTCYRVYDEEGRLVVVFKRVQ